MAKVSKKPVKDEEVETTESENAEVEATDTTEAPPATKRSVKKNSLTVTLPDGYVRTYSEYTHGKHWEILANNFAKSQGGEIA